MSILGKFLEIGVSSSNLIADMARLEDFGMQSLQVNETWPHHYGVMSDGQMHVGFHQHEFDSPSLTFVLPDLRNSIANIKALGLQTDYERFDDDHFHEAAFTDANGTRITLLEARTFSPTLPDDERACELGDFQRLLLPAAAGNDEFWHRIKNTELGWNTITIDTSESVALPTAVYRNDIETLVMQAAREGWRDFTIDQHDQGLVKTHHGFNLLIEKDQR